MKLLNIAIKNLKYNFSFYSLYLLSVSFVLMIFFCFISFANNEVIMEKISSDGRVEAMCSVVAVFIIVFVIFYMAYSNKFFIRRRMRELGIYSLQGFSKSSIFSLLMLENIFISLGGFTVGVLLGGFLHKSVVNAIVWLMGLSINTSAIPLINVNAAILSFVFVCFVTIALALSNMGVLIKTSLLDLVRIEKRFDKPIKHRVWLGFVGFLLLMSGYVLSLDIIRLNNSLWYRIGFSPIALLTMVLVVCGTILCVYSFIPLVFNYCKNRGMLFLKDTTIIVVPKFIQRIRLNAKSMILLILISAGTLAILGASVLSLWYPIEATKRIIPSAIEFRVENEAQISSVVASLSQNIGDNKFKAYKTTIVRVTATSKMLPYEYTVSKDKGRVPSLECISESDYIELLNLQDKESQDLGLKENESILIKYRVDRENADIGVIYSLNLENDTTVDVEVIATSLDNPIGFATAIFLIATGSILYFQNLSSVSYDKADYEMLSKMGYDEKKLKKIVRLQVRIYFLIPYLIGNSGAVLFPIGFSVLLFSVIYFVYYQITKHSCYKAALQ